jgi:hypothetical protein
MGLWIGIAAAVLLVGLVVVPLVSLGIMNCPAIAKWPNAFRSGPTFKA